MSDVTWFTYVSGKFYSMGRIYYDPTDQQFKDVSDLNMSNIPAYYSVTSLLDQNRNCTPLPNQLPMEFEMALMMLPTIERNLLLEKFNLAFSKLQSLQQNAQPENILKSSVIVSRKGTFVDYTSNLNMFVYVISDEAKDDFYFAEKIKSRDINDNRLYIYFVFERSQIGQ